MAGFRSKDIRGVVDRRRRRMVDRRRRKVIASKTTARRRSCRPGDFVHRFGARCTAQSAGGAVADSEHRPRDSRTAQRAGGNPGVEPKLRPKAKCPVQTAR